MKKKDYMLLKCYNMLINQNDNSTYIISVAGGVLQCMFNENFAGIMKFFRAGFLKLLIFFLHKLNQSNGCFW